MPNLPFRPSRGLFIALVSIMTAPVQGDVITSVFDTNAEGWTVISNGSSTTPDFVAVGGNPGGMIQDTDAESGVAWFFSAPAKFLGDQSRHFDHSLSFDLNQTGSGSQFDAVDVRILGGGLDLGLDIGPGLAGNPLPLGTFVSYNVFFNAAEGWENRDTSTAATDAEIQTALGSLTSLRIRGEFLSGSVGGDTARLDNVLLGATASSVPEPSSAIALAALGLTVGYFRKRRRSRATQNRP